MEAMGQLGGRAGDALQNWRQPVPLGERSGTCPTMAGPSGGRDYFFDASFRAGRAGSVLAADDSFPWA